MPFIVRTQKTCFFFNITFYFVGTFKQELHRNEWLSSYLVIIRKKNFLLSDYQQFIFCSFNFGFMFKENEEDEISKIRA
jgi:hypothetical protein